AAATHTSPDSCVAYHWITTPSGPQRWAPRAPRWSQEASAATPATSTSRRPSSSRRRRRLPHEDPLRVTLRRSVSGKYTRRTVIKTGAGAAVGGILLGSDPAEAARRHAHRHHRRKKHPKKPHGRS